MDGLSVVHGSTHVVSEVSFRVGAGESVAITGPSGSGKTSVLNCVIGTHTPTSGMVTVCGSRITELKAEHRARIRRTLIGVTFQSPDLLPELSIIDNVALTMLFDGMDRADSTAAARRSLTAVGVEGHDEKRTDEVSGGEAQRIALARALARDSIRVLVADEPTASLDAASAEIVADLIIERTRSRGLATVVATHDDRVALRCDRTIDLRLLAGATP